MTNELELDVEITITEAEQVFLVDEDVLKGHVESGTIPSRSLTRDGGEIKVIKCRHLCEKFYFRQRPPKSEGTSKLRSLWLALLGGAVGGVASNLSAEALELIRFILDSVSKDLPMVMLRYSGRSSASLPLETAKLEVKALSIEDTILAHDRYMSSRKDPAKPMPTTAKQTMDAGITKEKVIGYVLSKKKND